MSTEKYKISKKVDVWQKMNRKIKCPFCRYMFHQRDSLKVKALRVSLRNEAVVARTRRV